MLLQVRFWRKAQTNPNPAFESSWQRVQLSESQKQGDLQVAPQLAPAAQNAAQMAILKTTGAFASRRDDIESVASAAAASNARSCAEVDADTRSENRCPRPTAGISMPEERAGVKPMAGKRNPRHSLSGQLRPLKSRRRRGRATPGAPCLQQLQGWRRQRGRSGSFLRHTQPSRRPPRSPHRR